MDKKDMKKALIALGYTGKESKEVAKKILQNQYPSNKLVFEKIIKSWFMAPIKTKSKAVLEVFHVGHLAEDNINNSMAPFIKHHSKGLLEITKHFGTGLLQSKECTAAAVSPDQMVTI
jgi:hypothetical protein